MEEVKNGQPQKEEVIETQAYTLRIRISDDFMTAWIRLDQKPGEEMITEADIKRAVTNFGVKKGLIQENLDSVLAGEHNYSEVVIAEGRPCVDGEDGRYDLMVNVTANQSPKELPDGTVDYTDMNLFVPVSKGQLLVKYSPATVGSFGFSVTGQLLTPKKGKDQPPLHGSGFILSEDKKEYTAAYDGKIDYKAGELNVSHVLTVPGNLDTASGHVHFAGDVEVKGDVFPGIVIEAGGNVVISGYVSSATIIAGGDVVLKGGMQAKGVGSISAGGNVEAKFIEAAQVDCNGNLKTNYLLNCNLNINGSLTVAGKKGAIIGGSISCMKGISVAEIGNTAELPTKIFVGAGEDVLERVVDMKRKLKKTDEEIMLLQKGKKQIEEAAEAVREKNRAIYEKTLQALSLKQTEREDILLREHYLSDLISEGEKSKVKVSGKIYPRVTLSFQSQKFEVKEELKNVTVGFSEGQIVVFNNI